MSANMDFAVVESQEEIDRAESRLLERDLVPPFRAPRPLVDAVVRRIAPERAANLRPDPIKSWDVLRTVEAITANTTPEDPILDLGSVGCAILPALWQLGYKQLAGVDLNPQVLHMAHADAIDYRVGDLTHTDWPDDHFAALTSISVIEHGVPDEALLTEVARLLRPGGFFFFSTDYWPEKIDTSEIRLFDLPWRIFSAGEIDAFVELARAHGLEPAGDVAPVRVAPTNRPVHFAERDYTFVWGALVKR